MSSEVDRVKGDYDEGESQLAALVKEKSGLEENITQEQKKKQKKSEQNQLDDQRKNLTKLKSKSDSEQQQECQQPVSNEIKFIHKKKSMTDKMIDRIASIINGSDNQTFAVEDKHLQDDILVVEQTTEVKKNTRKSLSEFKVISNVKVPLPLPLPLNDSRPARRSIRLFTTRSLFTNGAAASAQNQNSSSINAYAKANDIESILEGASPSNQQSGIRRRTYTELNSLMRSRTREFVNAPIVEDKGKNEIDEDDDELENDNSDIDSVTGKNQMVIGEDLAMKRMKEQQARKYLRAKRVQSQANASNQVSKDSNQTGAVGVSSAAAANAATTPVVKYEYPFPYNMRIQQNEADEAFREVEEDIKEEYEYYSKKQIAKQEINRERWIFAEKKNEFEMLTLYADEYPFLQFRKFIMLLLKFISWIAYQIIKHRYFERIVLMVIIFNSIVQCMDDPTSNVSTPTMDAINTFFLIAYTVECVLKVLGLGMVMSKSAYLRDGWNILDFTIVVTSLVPYVVGSDSSMNLSALRSLRVLRPLKTISKIKSLKIVLMALFSSFPYLVNALIILVFFYLIFAIAGLQLFQGMLKKRCFDPKTGIIQFGMTDQPCGGQYECPEEYVCGKMYNNPIYGVYSFDTIFSSFLMVFVCVTLESWTQIMYYVFDSFTAISVIYFVVLAFIGAFFLINLTLAVIKAKFTSPEEYIAQQVQTVEKVETIDMERLRMFRRMERNHLKRKLQARKGILAVGAKEVDFQLDDDDGLFFNWEDLMKLKRISDKDDVVLLNEIRLSNLNKRIEKRREKLRARLQRAISRDALFKKQSTTKRATATATTDGDELDSERGNAGVEKIARALPNQKIIFYLSSKAHRNSSSASSNRNLQSNPNGHPHSRHQNPKPTAHHHNHHGKNTRNVEINSYNDQHSNSSIHQQESTVILKENVNRGGVGASSVDKQLQLKRQTSIEVVQDCGIGSNRSKHQNQSNNHHSHHHNHNHHHNYQLSANKIKIKKNREMQCFSFLGVQTSKPEKEADLGNIPNERAEMDEEDAKIFARLDEINRLEQEEVKQLEAGSSVDLDDCKVVNNVNLKRLRKLPDITNTLSILKLKTIKSTSGATPVEGGENDPRIWSENINAIRIKTLLGENNDEREITSKGEESKKSDRHDVLLRTEEKEIMTGRTSTALIAAATTTTNLQFKKLKQQRTMVTTASEYPKEGKDQNDSSSFSLESSRFHSEDCEGDDQQQKQSNPEKEMSKRVGVESKKQGTEAKEQKSKSDLATNSLKTQKKKNTVILIRKVFDDQLQAQVESDEDDDDDDDDDDEVGVNDPYFEKISTRPSLLMRSFNPVDKIIIASRRGSIGDEHMKENDLIASKPVQPNNNRRFSHKLGSVVEIKLDKIHDKQKQHQHHNHNHQSTHNNIQKSRQSMENFEVVQKKGVTANSNSNIKRTVTISGASRFYRTATIKQGADVGTLAKMATGVAGNLIRIGGVESQKKMALENVRHWKMMVDMSREQKSNSYSDVLYHRLKADQDKKIEDEQQKITNMKYDMVFRQREVIKSESQNSTNNSKSTPRTSTTNLKRKRQQITTCKNTGRGTPRSMESANGSRIKRKSVLPDGLAIFSSHSIINSIEDIDWNQNFKTHIRLPTRRSKQAELLCNPAGSNPGSQVIVFSSDQNGGEEQSSIFINGSMSKRRNPHVQSVLNSSFASVKDTFRNNRFKYKFARLNQNKEKILFTFDSIRRLIAAPSNPRPPFRTALDNLSNKSVYWDIRRLDYNAGSKSMNIWSGENVTKRTRDQTKHVNKILDMMSTSRQDTFVWVSGNFGFIRVMHKHYYNFVNGNIFNSISMAAVFLNTTVLAMQGMSEDDSVNNLLTTLNAVFSYIFIAEMAMKIIANGVLGYVRDKINLFDGFIVTISIVEIVMFSGGSKAVSAFRAVRIFRTFRVLRVTRLLRSLKFMSTIMSVINRTIDSFMYIALLLFLFIFIYSLLGMQIYGGLLNYTDNGGIRQNYDSFYNAFLSTFQIVTLENWPDILVTTSRSTVHPVITTIYLISWIFIGNYVFLNLFLAILLDGFVAEGNENEKEESELKAMALQNEGEDLTSDIDEEIQTHVLKQSKAQILEEKKKAIAYNQQQDGIAISNQPQYIGDSDVKLDSGEELEEVDQQNDKQKKELVLFVGIECRDSLYIFPKTSSFRIACYRIAQSPLFDNFILVMIVASSLKLVSDTYLSDDMILANQISDYFDFVFNSIFALETTTKIVAFGFLGDNNSYLTDTWSQLDFFIVVASLLDMSIASIDLPVIKIMRLLRTLRPLRFISHNVNMKVVVIALFESVGAIFNVLIVVLLIWLMFGILGISLIGDRMGYCNVKNYYGISLDMCLAQGNEWKRFETNFDNIASSMMTLLILSTLENWPNMMFQAQDSNSSDIGPIFNNYSIISIFYIVFILIGSFFLINLFIGVIFLKFTEAQKSQKTSIFLTDKQARWIEFQMMIIGVKAQFSQNKKPESSFRLFFWDLVNHKAFDLFIMACIVANIITMGLSYEGTTVTWDTNLSYVNYFFTAVFISEMLLKMISTGISIYLNNGWNKFDCFVVCSSIVDITMDLMGGSTFSFLRFGPQLARVVRVFRVTRLLKLVKSMRGLQKLIETLLFSLPSLVNVGALMFLFFFIFAVLGVFLFQDIETGVMINSYNNFKNFGNAMILLFRSSTGENWQYIMFDVSNDNNCKLNGICYTKFAEIYFVFFILVCVFVMLNLFILVLIQYFEDYHMKEDNPLDAFNENLNVFRSVWAKYTAFSSGLKISHKHIVNFLSELPTPLGYKDEALAVLQDLPQEFELQLDKHQIAKDVMDMKLPDDGFGNVFFNDCLFACMKKAYGAEIVNDGGMELRKFLLKQELETKKKIEEKKRIILLNQKKKVFQDANGNQTVNPIVLMLFCGMAFKSWRNYLEKIKDSAGNIQRPNSPFSSGSSSESSESSDSENEMDYIDDDGNHGDDSLGIGSQQLEDIDENSGEDEDDIQENEMEEEDEESDADQEQETRRRKQIMSGKSSLGYIEEDQYNGKGQTSQDIKRASIVEPYSYVSKQRGVGGIARGSQNQFNERKEGGISAAAGVTQDDNNNKKNNDNSDSEEEEKKRVKIERAGYDEEEDFEEKIRHENKWKEQERNFVLEQEQVFENQSSKNIDDQIGKTFIKIPNFFYADQENQKDQFVEIDSPLNFKKSERKNTKSNPNKTSSYSTSIPVGSRRPHNFSIN